MNILIAYATKSGTAKECASILAKSLDNHSVTVCDLDSVNPDISEFDFTVIGGNIRMGRLDRRAYNFISENLSELCSGKTGYFICNGFNDEDNGGDNPDTYFKKCFPKGAIDSAVIYDSFGGELKPEKLKGFEKLLVKIILKSKEEDDSFAKPNILTEAIGRFADNIKNTEV